jgi:hypothetical protein
MNLWRGVLDARRDKGEEEVEDEKSREFLLGPGPDVCVWLTQLDAII